MNYEAGLLAFFLFYVPIYLIYRGIKRDNMLLEEEYRRYRQGKR